MWTTNILNVVRHLKLRFKPCRLHLQKIEFPQIDITAKAIFDSLADPKNPSRAVWEIQPEHIKDIFREKAKPGSRNYHYGKNIVWAVRKDGTLVAFTPFTDKDTLQYINRVRENTPRFKQKEFKS